VGGTNKQISVGAY